MADFSPTPFDDMPHEVTASDGTTWAARVLDTSGEHPLLQRMARVRNFPGLIFHTERRTVELTPGAAEAFSAEGLADLIGAVVASEDRPPFQCVVSVSPADEDESPRRVRLTVEPGPSPETLLAVAHDVTDLLAMQQQLGHTGQMAAFGEMAAALFHEIGNPMGALHNALYILNRDLQLFGDDARLLNLALEEAGRLNDILKHFRSFARFPALDLAETDLHALAAGTLALLKKDQRVTDGLHLELHAQDESIHLPIDANQVRELLFNLLINGVEALEGRGRITVTLRRAMVEGHEHAVVEVSDDGPGISRANLGRIFQPFYSTRPEGIGIGLAIAQRIAQAHGGDIEVESVPGEGATFRVVLPIRQTV